MKKIELKQSPGAIVLGLVAGLLAIYLLAQWKWQMELPVLLYIAAGVGLLSALSQTLALWVAKAWMAFGQLMGKVVGSVLLSTVFLLILTPLARLKSLFSRSDKFTRQKDSPWIVRNHQFSRKDLEELW